MLDLNYWYVSCFTSENAREAVLHFCTGGHRDSKKVAMSNEFVYITNTPNFQSPPLSKYVSKKYSKV